MNSIIEEYKMWLELQGKSKNTLKTYTIPTKKFLEYISNLFSKNDLDSNFLRENLNKNLILKFLAEIKTKKNLDPNSLRLYIRAISSFLKFLDRPDIIKDIKVPKVDKRLPKYITIEDF
ncbi:MAG: phage integrase N-terminal SAM-like domain-containing protein, partial [Candidatus Aenigmatarchaeota archaeon]